MIQPPPAKPVETKPDKRINPLELAIAREVFTFLCNYPNTRVPYAHDLHIAIAAAAPRGSAWFTRDAVRNAINSLWARGYIEFQGEKLDGLSIAVLKPGAKL